MNYIVIVQYLNEYLNESNCKTLWLHYIIRSHLFISYTWVQHVCSCEYENMNMKPDPEVKTIADVVLFYMAILCTMLQEVETCFQNCLVCFCPCFSFFFLCISVSYFIVSHRNLFHLFLMLTLFSLDISLFSLYISLCTLYSIIFCSFLCVMCWFICRIWCVCNIYSRRFPSLLHGIILHEAFQRQSSWKEP